MTVLDDLVALDRIVTVAELERLVIRMEGVPSATRPLFPWEVRAHTDFAEIDRQQAAAYSAAATALDTLRDVVLDALTAAIAGETEPRALVAALTSFAATQPPAVRDAIVRCVAELTDTLVHIYGVAGVALLREAQAQGALGELPPVEPGIRRRVVEPLAASAPAWVWQRLVAAALQLDGARPSEPSAIVTAVRGTKLDAAYDLSRQAINVVHGQGRTAALSRLPEPKEVYASELLDRNTCLECRDVDGTQYPTLAAALADYPDAGPMKDCRGGDRCRGTLVFVWDEEDPTVR